MIKSLTLGNRQFPVNLIQGPLAGISCAPFRLLTWLYSKPAFSYTEMISCKTLNHQSVITKQRYITKDPDEGPVCFQLSSQNPIEISSAVRVATDLGANLIDLNCGCPVKKIRRRGTGSSLLANASLLYQLIYSMKKNTDVPVSVKIRVDGKSSDAYNEAVAKAINDAGADFVVVHGRHWQDDYNTPCHYEQIRFFVEHLSMPVIGNGDIRCLASLKQMLDTGCAGAMISRAGVGQPWLIRQLICEAQGIPFTPPSLPERGHLLIQHVTRLITLMGHETPALLQARQFARYYARHLPDRARFTAALNQCLTLDEFEKVCAPYFSL